MASRRTATPRRIGYRKIAAPPSQPCPTPPRNRSDHAKRLRAGGHGISPVTLTDGELSRTNENGAIDTTYWLDAVHAFGDLDYAGNDDAAVVLKLNGGGSGTFYSIHAVLNRDGQPLVLDGISIGDRTRV